MHDLLHTRSGDTWTQQIGSYPKLRISAEWLADQCQQSSLMVQHDGSGPRGMRLLTPNPEPPSEHEGDHPRPAPLTHSSGPTGAETSDGEWQPGLGVAGNGSSCGFPGISCEVQMTAAD